MVEARRGITRLLPPSQEPGSVQDGSGTVPVPECTWVQLMGWLCTEIGACEGSLLFQVPWTRPRRPRTGSGTRGGGRKGAGPLSLVGWPAGDVGWAGSEAEVGVCG